MRRRVRALLIAGAVVASLGAGAGPAAAGDYCLRVYYHWEFFGYIQTGDEVRQCADIPGFEDEAMCVTYEPENPGVINWESRYRVCEGDPSFNP